MLARMHNDCNAILQDVVIINGLNSTFGPPEHPAVRYKFKFTAHKSNPRCLIFLSRTNNSSGSITNLIILRLGQLHHKLGNLVIHIHHAENGGSIVGDSHLSIPVNHHLVKTCMQKWGGKNGSGEVTNVILAKRLKRPNWFILTIRSQRCFKRRRHCLGCHNMRLQKHKHFHISSHFKQHLFICLYMEARLKSPSARQSRNFKMDMMCIHNDHFGHSPVQQHPPTEHLTESTWASMLA